MLWGFGINFFQYCVYPFDCFLLFVNYFTQLGYPLGQLVMARKIVGRGDKWELYPTFLRNEPNG